MTQFQKPLVVLPKSTDRKHVNIRNNKILEIFYQDSFRCSWQQSISNGLTNKREHIWLCEQGSKGAASFITVGMRDSGDGTETLSTLFLDRLSTWWARRSMSSIFCPASIIDLSGESFSNMYKRQIPELFWLEFIMPLLSVTHCSHDVEILWSAKSEQWVPSL